MVLVVLSLPKHKSTGYLSDEVLNHQMSLDLLSFQIFKKTVEGIVINPTNKKQSDYREDYPQQRSPLVLGLHPGNFNGLSS